METVENKYITLAYKLYTIENGEKEFTEEAPAEHPFQFISGWASHWIFREPGERPEQRR